jgi:hypothetical protein
LDLEIRRRFSAADFDSAGNNPRDMRAELDDPIQDRIQPTNTPVLPFDPAELHGSIVTAMRLRVEYSVCPADVSHR